MSYHWAIKKSGWAAGALALMLISLESLSYGNRCQPQTPSPCGADGVCRPIRSTWGYSQTRWRAWPGEPMGQQPAEAGSDIAGPDELTLPDKELPSAEQEDLRGPAKAPKVKESEESAAPEGETQDAFDINPGEVPAIPTPEPLPAFSPQSSNELPGFPSLEDTPPALPESLREVAHAQHVPRLSAFQEIPTAEPVAIPQIRQTQPIRQVDWQQAPTIRLINPASAIVVQPETETLQQAIYFEASDQENNEPINR